ncbi:MAG TPA: S41 family peptidase [Bacteroidota bacterium]|nr:S41 family peptidase [Bacteroidota bacterium]
MKNWFLQRRHRIWMIALTTTIMGISAFGFVALSDSELLLKMYRGIDIFTKVYKEVAVNYVDEVDPEDFMRAGIDGMLKTLDPYTVYIEDKDGDEIDLVTTGKYGGIGVTIGLRDGAITVIDLLEGFSAAKQGVEVGDQIIAIDDKPVHGMPLQDIRMLVRGAPGTPIKMKMMREGEKDPLEFVMLREEISVRNVTYAGYVAEGIGYIRLERFSRTADDDLRNALKELQATGHLQGVILDLRDNPGGLLESAVNIVSKFVPDSSLVVSTRGRKSDSERKYFSTEKPMAGNIPLAVLVSRYSASASEIVAGAVQDLDAGVIVGTRTFGKGLVQTISRISENASLKMTTAKYYTPSGRCIQEVDYEHRDEDGDATAIPDSLKHSFTTKHNRIVWDGGGIAPDTAVTDSVHIPYLEALSHKSMFFQYANHYAAEKKTLPDSFKVTDDIIKDFERFLKEKGFEYREEGSEKLKELREIATTARYDRSFFDGVDKLEVMAKKEKELQIQRFRKEVGEVLYSEILGRMKGDKARMESVFPRDKQLQVAINIVKNKKTYHKLLNENKK